MKLYYRTIQPYLLSHHHITTSTPHLIFFSLLLLHLLQWRQLGPVGRLSEAEGGAVQHFSLAIFCKTLPH